MFLKFTVVRLFKLFSMWGYSKNSFCAEDGAFQCETGECIEGKYLCDGEPDCPDSSDENANNCTEWGFATYKVEKEVAGKNYFILTLLDCISRLIGGSRVEYGGAEFCFWNKSK